MKGAITQYIDVAQVVLYFFWAFFAYLIWYLRREDKREGYPLAYERPETRPYLNFPSIPPPKTFFLQNGTSVEAPRKEAPQGDIRATPIAGWPGAPLEPIGDGLHDAVGPGSFANRANTPDATLEGTPKIIPLRIAGADNAHRQFWLSGRDPDPRGMPVLGADRAVAGIVKDVWIDVSEVLARYFEVLLPSGASVLLPVPFASISSRPAGVHVSALLAAQFADVPKLANPDQVTFLEEDRITAFFGGGTLYATPLRREALL
jgi:photosynthetic reaction center H subunit